jgi:hypothetical protein
VDHQNIVRWQVDVSCSVGVSNWQSGTEQPHDYIMPNEVLNSEDPHGTNMDSLGQMNEELEVKQARSHPLYQASAQDGSYHCPFIATTGCNHKPTKLKCNYE